MDTEIKAKIIYTDEGASSTIEKVTKAVEGHAKASTDSAQATAKADTATKTATPNIGQFGSALGLAGQAVGKLNPALGGMVTLAGSATGAIQSLTTMGMGPLGIALGVISLAVSAGTAIYGMYTQSIEDTAKATEEERKKTEEATLALGTHTQALHDLIEMIDKRVARDKLAADTRARMAALEAGQGDLAHQQELVRERQSDVLFAKGQEQLKAMQYADSLARHDDALTAATLLGLTTATTAREAAERSLATAVHARGVAEQTANFEALVAAKALAEAAYAKAHPAATTPPTGGGSGRNRRAERAEQIMDEVQAEADAASALRQMNIDASDAEYTRRQDAYARMHDAEVERQEERSALDQETVAEELKRQDELITKTIERDKEAAAESLRIKKEAAEKAKAIQEASIGALSTGLDIMTSAMVRSAEGSGKSQREIARVTAEAAVITASIKAAIETAESIASFAAWDIPGGITHAAAAAAFISAAALAGTAKLPPAGGGGGGPATSRAGGGPGAKAEGGQAPGNVININWGSSGMVYAADRAQLGRDLSQIISESTSRLGRTG
jgi:hypothetical protein